MKPLIVANWKCNPQTFEEAKALFEVVSKEAEKIKKAEIVVCPPFVFLITLGSGLGLTLKIGGQNCFWEQKGAFTGEISPAMLKDIGCQYVIVGHSERRKYFGETNEIVNKKMKAVLDAGLKPIFCIGETAKERARQETEIVIKNQITEGLKDINTSKINEIVIAYEPVWAIGTGNACSVEESEKMRLFITKISGIEKILYGGSVNSRNSVGYIKKAGFQGLLVGGASLNAEEFAKIIKSAA